jgi:hypothetical protein
MLRFLRRPTFSFCSQTSFSASPSLLFSRKAREEGKAAIKKLKAAVKKSKEAVKKLKAGKKNGKERSLLLSVTHLDRHGAVPPCLHVR